MTPLGHGAVAFTSSALHSELRARTVLIALVVGGVLPDVDFLLLWAPSFNEWHRVVTHNLVFVVATALLGGALAWWRVARGRRCGAGPAGAVAVAMVLGGLLHLFVDSVMDGNPSNGVGVAYLWPFVEGTYSPFNVIPIAENPPTWRGLDRMVPSVLYGVAFELPFYAATAVLYFRRRRDRHSGALRTKG